MVGTPTRQNTPPKRWTTPPRPVTPPIGNPDYSYTSGWVNHGGQHQHLTGTAYQHMNQVRQEQAAHKAKREQWEKEVATGRGRRLADARAEETAQAASLPGPEATPEEMARFETSRLIGGTNPGDRPIRAQLEPPRRRARPKFVPGAPLPTPAALTTAQQTTLDQKPHYENQARKDLLERATYEAGREYQPLIDEQGNLVNRVAPRNAMQERALEEVSRLRPEAPVGSGRLRAHAEGLNQFDIANAERQLSSHANKPIGEALMELESPHEQRIINDMQERAMRDFDRDVAPRIYSAYGAKTQGRRSGQRDRAIAKALMDMQTDVRHEGNKLRQQNWTHSTGLAEHRQARQEHAAQSAIKTLHGAHHAEAERELTANKIAQDSQNQQFRQELDTLNLQNLMGSLKTAHNQAERDAAFKDWQERESHNAQMLTNYAGLVHNLPPSSMAQVMFGNSNVPTPYNQATGIGSVLGQLGSHLLPKHAKGDVVKAPTYDMVSNPYLPQALKAQEDIAHEYESQSRGGRGAIPHMLEKMFRGLTKHPSQSMRGFYEGAGEGLDAHREEETGMRQNKLQSMAVRAKIADSLREEARYDREQKRNELKDRNEHAYHMAMARLQESKGESPEDKALDRQYKMAQIAALEGKSRPQSIAIGSTIINPRQQIGLTPGDISQLKTIEKNRVDNSSKQGRYDTMLNFLKKQKEAGELPKTGRLAEATPNISDLSQEYARNLEGMVAGEAGDLSGMLTNAKLKFARGTKPTERDSVEKVQEFAQLGHDKYAKQVERDQIAEDFAAYNIPPRISFAAYDQWAKNGKKGDVVDYIQDILEGTSTVHESHNDDLAQMSNEELARIAGAQ